MKTASLKRSPAQAKKDEAVEYKPPEYSYGTCLSLDADMMKRLGLSSGLKAGTVLNIVGRAEIKRVTSSKSANGDDQSSMELQITDLGCEAQQTTKKLAATMYPGMSDANEPGESEG